MKKIICAWIEQIVQLDSEGERTKFIDGIRGVRVLNSWNENGKFIVHVKRPYNNNPMKRGDVDGKATAGEINNH